MVHFLRFAILAIVLGAISGHASVVLLLAAFELMSSSFHATQHHPDTPLASVWWKVLGLLVALFAVYALNAWGY